MSLQDPPGPLALPADRPRQDQSEPAQVHPQGEMIGKKGKDIVSIPIPLIDIPHFSYGDKQQGGVGQGEGEVGRAARPGRSRSRATGTAGRRGRGRALARGRRLARRAGRDPRRGAGAAEHRAARARRRSSPRRSSTPASTTGPESLRHFKRTYKQALKRQIAIGHVRPDKPVIVPIRDDKRYRSLEDAGRCRRPTRSSST